MAGLTGLNTRDGLNKTCCAAAGSCGYRTHYRLRIRPYHTIPYHTIVTSPAASRLWSQEQAHWTCTAAAKSWGARCVVLCAVVAVVAAVRPLRPCACQDKGARAARSKKAGARCCVLWLLWLLWWRPSAGCAHASFSSIVMIQGPVFCVLCQVQPGITLC